MKEQMDHERCSELLLPLVRDELDAAERGQVMAHLETCEECRRERTALEALMAQEVVPLTRAERTSLHSRVAEGLESRAPSATNAAPSARPGWLRRALPALGAVAVLALGVVFAANLTGGRVDGEGGSSSLQDSGGGDQGGGDSAGAEDAEAPAAEEGPAIEADGGRPVPFFDRRDQTFDQELLEELPLTANVGFKDAAAFRALKARNLAGSYSEALEAQAPADLKSQLRDCVETVAAGQGDVLPTYATRGQYEGEDALLLGFVSRSDSGPFNRYMLWLWPRGSCEVPLEYVSGPIKE